MRGYKVPSLFRLSANNSNNNNIYIHLFTTCTNILAAYICMFVHAKSLQLCLILCDTVGCSLPGSFFPGILQARCIYIYT